MGLLYKAYAALSSGAVLAALPSLWVYTRLTGRLARGFEERLGLVAAEKFRAGHPSRRVWIHAASLGEVRVARSIFNRLQQLVPGCEAILSTNTDHGHDLAQELFEPGSVLYAPLDFLPSVRRTLSCVNPRAMVFLETEIWPNWIREARRRGVPCALVHGRISRRSIGRYLALRPFFRDVLGNIHAFSMISEQDAWRIVAMGADPAKVEINGNAKHDLLASQTDHAIETGMRRFLGLKPHQPVLVGGSTREGEEEILIRVFKDLSKEFPDLLLIIAPRHIKRASRIQALIREQGLEVQLCTDLLQSGVERTAPVVLVDTFGELFKIYSVGTILFCGASLVPLGGQNPMEPAAWGKMVFYGPSMDDFAEAKQVLEEAHAGVEVRNSREFAEKALYFLNRQEELREGGRRAREAVLRIQGASEKHARVIARLMG